MKLVRIGNQSTNYDNKCRVVDNDGAWPQITYAIQGNCALNQLCHMYYIDSRHNWEKFKNFLKTQPQLKNGEDGCPIGMWTANVFIFSIKTIKVPSFIKEDPEVTEICRFINHAHSGHEISLFKLEF